METLIRVKVPFLLAFGGSFVAIERDEALQMDVICKASLLVPRARIELATPRFSGACSTD